MNPLAAVRLLVTDVDGVLTDNTFIYGPDGQKYRRWNMADGQGIIRLREIGIETVFLTQEDDADIEMRAVALHVAYLVGGAAKLSTLQSYLRGRDFYDATGLAHIAYIGNDLNDQPVLQAVGFPFVPADAWVTWSRLGRSGGDGCLREVAERILSAKAVLV